MSHTWMSHVTQRARTALPCCESQPCVWRDSLICETWLMCDWCVMRLIHTCDMLQDASVVVFWGGKRRTTHLSQRLIRMCEMTRSHVWRDSSTFICVSDSFVCVKCLIHMRDVTPPNLSQRLDRMCKMTNSYVGHDSFIYETRLIHMCDMTHSYEWHDSLICVTWLIDMCDLTHSHVWLDLFTCATWLLCRRN